MQAIPDDMKYFVRHLPGPIVGFSLAAICLGIAALGLIDDTAPLGVKLGLGIPFGALSLVFVVVALRPPTKHPGIVAFRDRRQDIVWLYVFRQNVNGRHANSALIIGLIDGKTPQLPIRKGSEEEFLAYATSLAPRASRGYTSELLQQFRINPASMLQG